MSLVCTSIRTISEHIATRINYRYFSSLAVSIDSYKCEYSSFGNPLKVCRVSKQNIEFSHDHPDFENKVLLETIATPINPSDINMIQGKYARLPELPATAGNEGLFKVLSLGSKIKNKRQLNIGDLCVAEQPLLGTWSQYLVLHEKQLLPLNISISESTVINELLFQLCQIAVNPCTAYRMINDFAALNENDYIMQNAANSAVGECVIQIAKALKLRTVNIIRGSRQQSTEHRSLQEFEQIANHLYDLGADYVFGDADLASLHKTMTATERAELSGVNAPKLGLNCVGGEVATSMIRLLNKSATLVTYGGMSMKPITASTAAFIFNDISLKGFWMSRWKELCLSDDNLRKEYLDMIDALKQMMIRKELVLSYNLREFGDRGEGMIDALSYSMSQSKKKSSTGKTILTY